MRLRFTALFPLLTLASVRVACGQGLPMAGQLQSGEITIVFTATTVSCSGLSPGDSVSLAGFMMDRQAGSQTVTTPAISQTADSSGNFTATIEGGVKPRSIWLLIDQATGSYTVAEPEGSVLTQIPSQAITITGNSQPNSADVTIHRAHTHVMWIREASEITIGEERLRRPKAMDESPTNFAIYDAKDGSQSDGDGTIDGIVHITVPSFFDSNQISTCLFVVDDRTLEFYVFYLRYNHGDPGPCRPGAC